MDGVCRGLELELQKGAWEREAWIVYVSIVQIHMV